MIKQINIRLINKIKKTTEGSKFLNGLFNILTILIYPIIIVFGLIYILFFAVVGLFQKITMSKTEREKFNSELTNNVNEQPWTIWTDLNGVRFLRKFNGEVRFGPAYFNVKSEPTILGLDNKLFGDWFFQYKNGLLFQQWNSTDNPNTDLIYFDSDTKLIKTIENNIPSVLWDIVEKNNGLLELNCDTGYEIIKYEIEIKNGS
jgi:hypothetical protein